MTLRAPLFALVLVGLGLAPSVARALEDGQTCFVNQDVEINVRGRYGSATLPIAEGDEVTILSLTPSVVRVKSGDKTGTIDRSALEEACQARKERCQLKKAVKVEEYPDENGRVWRIKAGAILTVEQRAPAWTQVKIGPVQGYVKSPKLKEQCLALGQGEGDATADKATAPPKPRTPIAVPEPDEGQAVVFVPFVLDDKADPAFAGLIEDQLAAAVKDRRTDFKGPPGERPSSKDRVAGLKQHLLDIVRPARKMGIDRVITGRLERLVEEGAEPEPEPAPGYEDPRLVGPDEEEPAEAETKARNVLRVVVFDPQAAKVLKTVVTEPSLQVGHTWAREVAKALEPTLSAGGKKAGLEEEEVEEGATRTAAADEEEGAKEPVSEADAAPSVLPWVGGGVLAGGAAVALVGAALGGTSLGLSLFASQMTQVDPTRQPLALASLGAGAGADLALVVAGVLALGGGALLLAGLVME